MKVNDFFKTLMKNFKDKPQDAEQEIRKFVTKELEKETKRLKE